MEKEFITIFGANDARRLLKAGYTIVDIKPNRRDEDGKRSVFVFKNEEGLMEELITKKGTKAYDQGVQE